MKTPTPKQRRQELIEHYVLSRRTMMALMIFKIKLLNVIKLLIFIKEQ